MHIIEAIKLRDLIDEAIEQAEITGSTEVVLSKTAAELDDAAREELDAAIKEAEQR